MFDLDETPLVVRRRAIPVDTNGHEYGWMEEIRSDLQQARFVLLGEATHGTHEFYQLRAEVTKHLIREWGFDTVVIEGDWPDTYRVNRYVTGAGADGGAEAALGDFKRFPHWMWRNADFLDFVGWLKHYNDSLADSRASVELLGMDLYSLHRSMEQVIEYLDSVDREAGRLARQRYGCFDRFGPDPRLYARHVGGGREAGCEAEAVRQLQDLEARGLLLGERADDRDRHFSAAQNARIVKNAEQYYRTMLRGNVSSWNLRDRHMVDTLEALRERNEESRIVVWAHNSHLGDARATQMAERGEWNVGQLIREIYGDQAYLLGFTTYGGTVTAASDWDAPAERKRVRPALSGSYEDVFHRARIPRFFLNLRKDPALQKALSAPRLERAIGVLYLPETERMSHYFKARISDQFDGLLHVDDTRAVEPLDRHSRWREGEVPETYPSAV